MPQTPSPIPWHKNPLLLPAVCCTIIAIILWSCIIFPNARPVICTIPGYTGSSVLCDGRDVDEQDKVRDGIRGVRTLELAGTTAICPHNLISEWMPKKRLLAARLRSE
ncbi:hypothetical protein H9L39_05390 [Fusarium oxysporum f. sp. albedinis]|nr:hypothetical protein H9L39_05390 [Fusarium oxysporum f. sp. albedinis]